MFDVNHCGKSSQDSQVVAGCPAASWPIEHVTKRLKLQWKKYKFCFYTNFKFCILNLSLKLCFLKNVLSEIAMLIGTCRPLDVSLTKHSGTLKNKFWFYFIKTTNLSKSTINILFFKEFKLWKYARYHCIHTRVGAVMRASLTTITIVHTFCHSKSWLLFNIFVWNWIWVNRFEI